MKNLKLSLVILLLSICFLFTIKPSFALNNYAVYPGANFRWDGSKYLYNDPDGAGGNPPIIISETYFMEFNFTNWAGIAGAEYLNGTLNVNGTLSTGEISHEYYYSRVPGGNIWATDILDVSVAAYPIHVYLVSNIEIEQTTRPDLLNAASHPDLTFTEVSTYNYSLTGSFTAPTGTYTGKIRFNSDKVLSYLFDEMVISDTFIERYIWTLTYIPGIPTNGGAIPGFQIWAILSVIFLGVLLVYKKFRINQEKL